MREESQRSIIESMPFSTVLVRSRRKKASCAPGKREANLYLETSVPMPIQTLAVPSRASKFRQHDQVFCSLSPRALHERFQYGAYLSVHRRTWTSAPLSALLHKTSPQAFKGSAPVRTVDHSAALSLASAPESKIPCFRARTPTSSGPTVDLGRARPPPHRFCDQPNRPGDLGVPRNRLAIENAPA